MTKQKNIKFIKSKDFCESKDMISRWKSLGEWEKIFAIYISDKIIFKELLQLNNKTRNNPF